MSDLLRVKRGQFVDLPELMQGEFGWCLDNEKLFIGGDNGNVGLPNQKNIDELGVSVKQFGAVGDGVHDDTIAFQLALNSGKNIFVPVGAYRITSTLTMVNSGSRLKGVGTYGLLSLPQIPNGSVIVSEVTNGATLKIQDGLQFIEIGNLTITKTNTAVLGNNGIEFDGNSNLCKITNVEISKHWIGLKLGSTGFSEVKDIFIHDNYSDGVFIQNTVLNGSMQWQFGGKCLSQLNDGWGFIMKSQTNAFGHSTVGTMTGLNTYGNKKGGVAFSGVETSPINGIRLSDCFMGEDGGDEIYINTYGTGSHIINNVFVEASGTGSTGVGQSTPPSHKGHGMNVVNCYSVTLNNCAFIGNSYNGIMSYAQLLQLNNCDLRLNGSSGESGVQNGIYISDGKLTMNGGKSMGHQFGVFLQADNYHIIVGTRLQENSVTGLASAVSPLVNTIDIGNIKN